MNCCQSDSSSGLPAHSPLECLRYFAKKHRGRPGRDARRRSSRRGHFSLEVLERRDTPAAGPLGLNVLTQYVDAMKGKTWDAALLGRWLTDTQAVAPGSTMVYFQDDPKKRAALIEYLQSLK